MRMKIGEFLVSKGILTPAQVDQILNYSRMRGLRFGEAGLEMGLLTTESMVRAFGPNYQVDFFHLVPEYFPTATRDLFDTEFLLKWGVLPLGYKTVWKYFRPKRLLNIGLIDPTRKESLDAVHEAASRLLGDTSWVGTQRYLILAEEFVRVLDKIYGVAADQVLKKSTDPTLRLYLETD